MKKTWTIHQLERKSDNGFVTFSITDGDYYTDTYGVVTYKRK